jgi:hypothetical protein
MMLPSLSNGKIVVTLDEIRKNAFAMPVHNRAIPRPPFRFLNREYFIISYKTDIDAVRAVDPMAGGRSIGGFRNPAVLQKSQVESVGGAA